MRIFGGLAIALSLTLAGPASAQWLYQGEESAFGSGGTHIAFTALPGGYGFGLRCLNGKPQAIYMTPDTSFDEAAYTLANVSKPLLKVRIDNEPVMELAGTIIDTEGKAAVLVDADAALFRAVGSAKKRVAVVLTLLGDNFHEKSFNVRGSTNAITKLAEACGVSME